MFFLHCLEIVLLLFVRSFFSAEKGGNFSDKRRRSKKADEKSCVLCWPSSSSSSWSYLLLRFLYFVSPFSQKNE